MSRSRPTTDCPRNEPGLVDKFLGTSYDVVKGVYDNLEELARLDAIVADIPELGVNAVEAAMVPARVEIAEGVADAAEQVVLATDQAELAAQHAQDAHSINSFYPFALEDGKIQYDVRTISGDSKATTASLALWVEGAIDYAFVIDSPTLFTLSDPVALYGVQQIGIIINARFDDVVGNMQKLEEGFEAEFADFLANSSYEVPVAYVGGITLTRSTQALSYLGELYAPKYQYLPFTTSNWGVDSLKLSAIGDAKLRQELAAPTGSRVVRHSQATGTPRTVESKLNDFFSLSDFAADPLGIALCDTAGAVAEILSKVIYVPAGIWRFSSPMVHGFATKFFGPGVLKYDNAEWWRKGGSSGSLIIPEDYTLLYNFTAQADVSITYDGVAQAFTWSGIRTIQAPGTSTAVNVKINITNGTLPLTMFPESPRSYNAFGTSEASKVNPSLPNPVTNPKGMNNVSFGPRCLMDLTDGGNNTAYGSRVLMSVQSGENNTGMGFQALYRATGSNNTGLGSISGEHLTTGTENTFVGAASGGGLTTGIGNVGVGFEALNETKTTSYTVAIGYRALANGGSASVSSQSVAIGAFSQDFGMGLSNSSVGYRALNGDGVGGLTGTDNTALGAFAGRHLTAGKFNTVIGSLSLLAETTVDELVAIGYSTLTANRGGIHNTAVGTYSQKLNVSGSDNTTLGWDTLAFNVSTVGANTAIGSRSQETSTTGANNTSVGFEATRFLTTGLNNSTIGSRSGRSITTANDNVAIGADALQFETTGSTNTALGRSALRLLQDTTSHVGISNSTGVGANSKVSGSNQVQLGDSATTTYVYGTVQNRSDARDKADVRDTVLGLDFVLGLRPVEGRWDMREDYFTETTVLDEEGNEQIVRTPSERDGSKVRARYHQWFLAQEVKTLCDTLGVDFGGYQDHKMSEGCDVLTLGYDEFIPPIVKAIQEISLTVNQRLLAIEERLASLGK